MTRYATVKEQDQACAAILVDKLRGYVKCEGRRWYLQNDDAGRWDRATVSHGISLHILQEVRDLIVEAVAEDRYEDARGWCRYLDPTDVGTRLTPYMSRVYRETEALPRRWG